MNPESRESQSRMLLLSPHNNTTFQYLVVQFIKVNLRDLKYL